MRQGLGRLVLVGVFASIVIAAWVTGPGSQARGQYTNATPTTVVNAVPRDRVVANVSSDPAAQVAIDTAVAGAAQLYPVLSGRPSAIHTQRVMFADVSYLGITSLPASAANDEPFWLVVIGGDFDPGERNMVSAENGVRPRLDYIVVLVSEPANRVVYLRLAPGMYGLGCVFHDASLPGGLSYCTPELIAHGLAAAQSPRPTPVPPGTVLGGYSGDDLRTIRERYPPNLRNGSGEGAIVVGSGTPAVDVAPALVGTATSTPTVGPTPTRNLER